MEIVGYEVLYNYCYINAGQLQIGTLFIAQIMYSFKGLILGSFWKESMLEIYV